MASRETFEAIKKFDQKRYILQTASLLMLFAVIGSGLVAYSYQMTYQQIEANERAALLENLNALIPKEKYDNDFFNDVMQIQPDVLLGTQELTLAYRARYQGKPVAVVFSAIAPDGYNGPIKLLIGMDNQGVIAGVRVISHQETPGLGDLIESRRSDWILDFKGRSLHNPSIASGWNVKRDGGVFDQLTGATITPRAIVKAIHKSLFFFQQHQEKLFALYTSEK